MKKKLSMVLAVLLLAGMLLTLAACVPKDVIGRYKINYKGGIKIVEITSKTVKIGNDEYKITDSQSSFSPDGSGADHLFSAHYDGKQSNLISIYYEKDYGFVHGHISIDNISYVLGR